MDTDIPTGIVPADGPIIDLDHANGLVTITVPGVTTIRFTPEEAGVLEEHLPAYRAAAKALRSALRGNAEAVTLVERRPS